MYLAMEENTAIKEMKPILGQEYSIAVGNCTRTLKLADLVNKKKFGKNPAFLCFLSSKISEPNIEIDEEFYKNGARLFDENGYIKISECEVIYE